MIPEYQYFLVPPKCCSTVRIYGWNTQKFNQLYFINGTRPVYIDSMNKYGIWFDGEWTVGLIELIDWAELKNPDHCPVEQETFKDAMECYG
mgnify:CR=1 FL=1